MSSSRKYLRLLDHGVLNVGINVSVHESVILSDPEKISFGDNVKIDEFCVISAGAEGVHFGRNIHIGSMSSIFGGGGRITIEDFSSLSDRVTLYTTSEDKTGDVMTNPTVSAKFRRITNGPVTICCQAIVGTGSIIMPNVRVGLGSAVGPLSYVVGDVPDLEVYSGVPACRIGARSKKHLELRAKYQADFV